MINLKPVEGSSQIIGVGYSEENQVLRIRFKKGEAEYDYADVPRSEHDALLNSKSIGKHFHQHIKGAYEYQRVHQA